MIAKFRSSDNRYRYKARTAELQRLCLVYLMKCSKLSIVQKQRLLSKNFVLRFSSLNSRSRVRSGCVFTGHTRFVIRAVRLSRMQFKNNASSGLIMGFTRST